MKSLKKVFLLLFFALIVTFSLCACDAGNSETTPSAVTTATTKPSATKAPTVAPTTAKPTVSPATTAPVPTETPEPPKPTEKPFDNLFEILPDEFTFSSGAGAWRTVLTIADDGSFIGEYTDWDATTGDRHPNGTVRICNFKGKFTKPEKVSDFVYSMHLESLQTEGTLGDVYYEKDLKHIVSSPYGLNNADELYIYLPGATIADLPEMFLSWVHLHDGIRKTVPSDFYGLYNLGGEQGFVGMTENNIWKKRYTFSPAGDDDAFLSPHYAEPSLVVFWPREGQEEIRLCFSWEEDNQREFKAVDVNGSGEYDIILDFSEDLSTVNVTVKSANGTDLSAWGGTKNGFFQAEMVSEK